MVRVLGKAWALVLGLTLAAQAFDSPTKLKVFAGGAGGKMPAVIGFTPSPDKDVSVPLLGFWFVRPLGALTPERWDTLLQTLRTARVPGLDLSNRWDVSDADARRLKNLRHLRMVSFVQTPMGDAALQAFCQLPSLQILAVNRRITDKGLSAIAAAQTLRELDLTDAPITDAGLSHLTALPHLRRLRVSGTRITDAAGASLSQMSALRQLDISRTALTEKSLAALGALRFLEDLDLTGTAVEYNDLKALLPLRRLKILRLPGTHLSREQARTLSKLPSLQAVMLNDLPLSPKTLTYLLTMANIPLVHEKNSDSFSPAQASAIGRHAARRASSPELMHSRTRTIRGAAEPVSESPPAENVSAAARSEPIAPLTSDDPRQSLGEIVIRSQPLRR